MWFLKFLCLCLFLKDAYLSNTKPNIIVIVADDMGWNDVGFHGSNEIPTPNIDALAYNGVILNGHYTQALCTPSRSAFLTGKYPIHLGMQHLVILEPEPWGLPLNETLMPERLKNHGYKTHAVGKWHLGFFKKEYTPTYRGFDSHFGYWQGLQDYYEHTVHSTFSSEFGYDMRRNMSVDWDAKGKYSTTLFTEEAVRLIKEHNVDDPMFMYLAHLAPHAGNDEEPLQAPDEEIAKFSYIRDPERRIYAAMVSLLDKSVGEVVSALRERRMLENTIILFLSDNGSPTDGIHSNHGSNYPLRGMKNSPWEGALRGLAAIWSPLIKRPQRVSTELMHISDWLPTFYSAAGLNTSELKDIDGKDMWQSISDAVQGPRTEIVHNIDDVWKYGALRQGDWKYLYGSPSKGAKDNWYGSVGNDSHYSYDEDEVLQSKTASALAGVITYRQIKEKYNNIKTGNNETDFTVNLMDSHKIRIIRESAQVRCSKDSVLPRTAECSPMRSPCLFNMRDDPCEMVNLADTHPLLVLKMKDALAEIGKTALPPRNLPRDPNCDPAKFNNTWTNWQDYEDITREKMFHNILSPLTVGLISAACVAFFIVITVLLIISVKNSNKSKNLSIFKELEDPKEDDAADFILKDRELTRIAYRDDAKTRE